MFPARGIHLAVPYKNGPKSSILLLHLLPLLVNVKPHPRHYHCLTKPCRNIPHHWAASTPLRNIHSPLCLHRLLKGPIMVVVPTIVGSVRRPQPPANQPALVWVPVVPLSHPHHLRQVVRSSPLYHQLHQPASPSLSTCMHT